MPPETPVTEYTSPVLASVLFPPKQVRRMEFLPFAKVFSQLLRLGIPIARSTLSVPARRQVASGSVLPVLDEAALRPDPVSQPDRI